MAAAARWVKVRTASSRGATPYSRMSQAILWIRREVLPLPAPARTRSGPLTYWIADFWAGVSSVKAAINFYPRHGRSARVAVRGGVCGDRAGRRRRGEHRLAAGAGTGGAQAQRLEPRWF